MTCQEMIDFLLDYVEGQLPENQTQAIDQHLALCPECVDYLKSYRSTIQVTQLLCHDQSGPPEAIPEDLVSAIMEAHRAAS